MNIENYKYWEKVGYIYKNTLRNNETHFIIEKKKYKCPYYNSFNRHFGLLYLEEDFIGYDFQLIIFTEYYRNSLIKDDEELSYYTTQVGCNSMEDVDQFISLYPYERHKFIMNREITRRIDKEILTSLRELGEK